jgi:hypothetical protein
VEAYLPKVINGERVFLDSEQQQTLAVWSLKTILMMAKAHNPPEPVIPASDYTAFYRERQPNTSMLARTGFAVMPENAQVAVACDFNCQAVAVPNGHGYIATMRLGMFVVQFLRAGPFADQALAPFPPTLQLVPLWPVAAPRHWPPLLPILHKDWKRFTEPDHVELTLIAADQQADQGRTEKESV